MARTSKFQRFRVLVTMQLARLRTSWRPYLIVSTAMPLGIAVLLRAIMNESQIESFGPQIVAGSVVLAISMTGLVMLAQRMASLRESGAIDLYATLPVSRASVVGAVLISFAVFALPGAVLVVILGSRMFDLSLDALWLVVPVWALGSFALAGIGAIIGARAPDEQLAGMFSNLAMMAVLFLGILPQGRLPSWIAPVKRVLPSTYAVEALQPAFDGSFTVGQGWDLLVLAGFGAVFFWAVRGPLWPSQE